MCTHSNDIAALLCHLGALGRQNWYTGMDAAENIENEVGEVQAESGSVHAEHDAEKVDLLTIIRSLPPAELAVCIPPIILNRVRVLSHQAQAVVDEKQLPREFRVNKVWWEASQDSKEQKQKFILDQLEKKCKTNIITSIIVPECLPSSSFDISTQLANVLSHCPDLIHLDLSKNWIEWQRFSQGQ